MHGIWIFRMKGRFGMTWAKNTEWLKKFWKRYRYVALVILAGAFILLLPTGSGGSGETEGTKRPAAAETGRTLEQTEERMQQILSRIEGVGQLELMLTVESGTANTLAEDTELTYSGAAAAPDDYSRRSETVIVSGDGGDEPVVTGTAAPVYRGALVVCEGGNDAAVRLAVIQAVSALTGLSSDRISVIQCQS